MKVGFNEHEAYNRIVDIDPTGQKVVGIEASLLAQLIDCSLLSPEAKEEIIVCAERQLDTSIGNDRIK